MTDDEANDPREEIRPGVYDRRIGDARDEGKLTSLPILPFTLCFEIARLIFSLRSILSRRLAFIEA
jgi:hypothetical protein